MHAISTLFFAQMALTVLAAPFARESACSSYTIINTRGTGEAPGESSGFRTVNRDLLAQLPGGKRYNTVYPADVSQNSRAGTDDIVRYITRALASAPRECFILEGYSQGAAATVNALAGIRDSAASAVKAVLLIGNPEHKSGLGCNVDIAGGASTKNVNGMQIAMNHIPDAWVGKTLDVCNYGDGVCDTTHGMGINAQHLAYPNDRGYQAMATRFLINQLRNSGSSTSDSLNVQQGTGRPAIPSPDGSAGQQGMGRPATSSPWMGMFSASRQPGAGAPTTQSGWFQWPSFGEWSRPSTRASVKYQQPGADTVVTV